MPFPAAAQTCAVAGGSQIQFYHKPTLEVQHALDQALFLKEALPELCKTCSLILWADCYMATSQGLTQGPLGYPLLQGTIPGTLPFPLPGLTMVQEWFSSPITLCLTPSPDNEALPSVFQGARNICMP